MRGETKHVTKHDAISSILKKDVPISPGFAFVDNQGDTKTAIISIIGEKFGGAPVTLDLKLQVEDSPNSAGVSIDAVRSCKLAMDRRLAGRSRPRQRTSSSTAGAIPGRCREGANGRVRRRKIARRRASKATWAVVTHESTGNNSKARDKNKATNERKHVMSKNWLFMALMAGSWASAPARRKRRTLSASRCQCSPTHSGSGTSTSSNRWAAARRSGQRRGLPEPGSKAAPGH